MPKISLFPMQMAIFAYSKNFAQLSSLPDFTLDELTESNQDVVKKIANDLHNEFKETENTDVKRPLVDVALVEATTGSPNERQAVKRLKVPNPLKQRVHLETLQTSVDDIHFNMLRTLLDYNGIGDEASFYYWLFERKTGFFPITRIYSKYVYET